MILPTDAILTYSPEDQREVAEFVTKFAAMLDNRQCISCGSKPDPYGNWPCGCAGKHE